MPARVAADPREPAGENSAAQERPQLLRHEGRHPDPVCRPLPGLQPTIGACAQGVCDPAGATEGAVDGARTFCSASTILAGSKGLRM